MDDFLPTFLRTFLTTWNEVGFEGNQQESLGFLKGKGGDANTAAFLNDPVGATAPDFDRSVRWKVHVN